MSNVHPEFEKILKPFSPAWFEKAIDIVYTVKHQAMIIAFTELDVKYQFSKRYHNLDILEINVKAGDILKLIDKAEGLNNVTDTIDRYLRKKEGIDV